MSDTTISPDNLPMTLKQASVEYFRRNISYGKLRALARAGKLPVIMIGGRYFTRKDLLYNWFIQQQSKCISDASNQYGNLRVIGN